MSNIYQKEELNRIVALLNDAAQQVVLEQFDEPTIGILKEAMQFFEEWQVEEQLMKVYTYWADFQASQHKLTNAIAYLNKSLRIRQKLEDSFNEELWKAHFQLGDWHNTLNKFDIAKIHLDKALEISLDIFGENHLNTIETYTEYGVFYFNQYQFTRAIELFHKTERIAKTLQPRSESLLSGIYSDLAVNYAQVFDYDTALDYYQKAIELNKKLYHPMHPSLASIYLNYSAMHTRKGDVNRAILFLHKAMDIHEHNQMGGVRTVYPYRSLLGIHGVQGNLEEAQKYGEKALEILEKYEITTHRAAFAVHMALGGNYMRMGNLDRSFTLLSKALQISKDLNGENNLLQGSALLELGLVFTEREEFDLAKAYFQDALETLKSCKHVEFRGIPDVWRGIGLMHEKMQDFPAALEAYQKVLVAITIGYDSADVYDYPFFDFKNTDFEIKQKHHSWLSIILLKAHAFFDYYQEKSHDIKDLKAAFRGYELTYHFLDQIRQSFQSQHSKLSIVQKIEKRLLRSVEVSYQLFEATQDPYYLQSAFRFSEKNKAYLMLQSNSEKMAKQVAEIPKELLEQEQLIISQLAKLKKKIQSRNQQSEGGNQALFRSLKNDYFNAYNTFEAFKDQLEIDYPIYYRLKYNTSMVEIETLQRSLSNNQTILSYFVGNQSIYLFAITADEFEVFSQPKPDNWSELLQKYLHSIKYHQKTDFQQYSFELYRTLLQEAMHHVVNAFTDEAKQVFIIPHSELHYLPFETLTIQEADASNSYQELDYLLNYSQISYHYSATLLQFDLQQVPIAESAPIEMTFTGFAPVYSSSSTNQQIALESLQSEHARAVNRSNAVRSDGTWVHLPHSKTEVENIAELFEREGHESQNFLYEAANKSNLEAQIGKSRFVLIAAHGIVNHEYPELSGLVLASDSEQQIVGAKQKAENGILETMDEERSIEQTAVEDCILNMKEVAMIPMSADLVVLSSCESGIGELHKGEGMMAVNRGFLASGAKNVVSTLFKVNDRASSELTQLLFTHILKGENYSTALQKAKLELLKKQGMSPKAWSGFVLFGKGGNGEQKVVEK
ncbi:MAG: CHAT domain-containing protein [Chitinophagales bacterium]